MSEQHEQNEQSLQCDAIDHELLAVIRCPINHSTLFLSNDGQFLINKSSRIAYPIRNNSPDLRLESLRESLPKTAEKTEEL